MDWALKPVQQQIMELEEIQPDPALVISDPDRLLIDAQNDREAIGQYLLIRCQKATTRNAVQRDLRKFAVFMHREGLQRLREVKAEHCQAFQAWLMDPEPELCTGTGRPPPLSLLHNGQEVPNPDWRPFRGPLSPVSANQTISKIQALFGWLVNAGYLSGNPWTLIKPATRATTKTSDETDDGDTRELPLTCIKAVLAYLDQGNDSNQIEPRRFAQWRWFFYFYLLTAARVSSGCTATIDDIYRNRKGYDQLTLTVKGTGIRRKDVPWIPELEREYLRYRTALGLPPIVLHKGSRRRQHNDPLPQGLRHLLLPITVSAKTRTSKPLSYQSVHGHLVDLFRATRVWVIKNQKIHLEDWELAILNDATGHWIRHGTATLLGIHAKSQLGHSSQKQTDVYQAAEIQQHRHRLRHLIDSDESPYHALLDEPIAVRMQWVNALMNSIDKDSPEALDEVWANFMSSVRK